MDKVVLITRRAGSEKAIHWESTGDGEYSLSETEKSGRGILIRTGTMDAVRSLGFGAQNKEGFLNLRQRQFEAEPAAPNLGWVRTSLVFA